MNTKPVQYHATGSNVLVKLVTNAPVTKSGLFLPVADRPERLPDSQLPLEALISSVGPKVTVPIKRGDRIVYDRFAGTHIGDVTADGYLVLDQNSVLAIIDTSGHLWVRESTNE
jgi:chaperonin GroES